MANNKTENSKNKTTKTESTSKSSAAPKKAADKAPAAKSVSEVKKDEPKTKKAVVKNEAEKSAPKDSSKAKPVAEKETTPKAKKAEEPKAEVKKSEVKEEPKADKAEPKSKKAEESKEEAKKPEVKEEPKADKAEPKSKKAEEPKEEDRKPEVKEEPKTDKAAKSKKSEEPKLDESTPEGVIAKFRKTNKSGKLKDPKPKKEKPELTPEQKKKRKLLITIIASVLAAVIAITAILLCIFLPRKEDIPDVAVPDYDDPIRGSDASTVYKPDNPQVTKVGYNAEYLGTVERKIPTAAKNEGLVAQGKIPRYPTYGSTVSMTTEQKNAIINESSWYLPTINTRIGSDGFPKNTWNSMDENGRLYLNGVDTGRTLYKHTSATGMYYGNVSDSEPGIVKRMTMNPRGYTRGYNVTGLYAPAGEVLKIEISQADMQATGGIVVYMGQALYNSKANNIWNQRSINRMPTILNTQYITAQTATLNNGVYTAYIGSFLGGPIYIGNESVKFSVTITGGVRYSHFILGYTTREEFEENKKSSAPYFDLEVWEYGVLHSGPKKYAQKYSYDDIYKAAVLWDKIALVSTRRSLQGIVFLYDPFVAAGAAVAFPGQGAVNCPAGWMTGSLDYNAFVNGGSWGNMHEYNHNFQGWGLPNGGEVTNNALNLVEYSLFTRISANRKIGNSAEGQGGWNRYTSPSWAVGQIKGSRENDLAIYSVLLHSFGQENFMNCVNTSGTDNYFKRWSAVTHQNFTYFSDSCVKNYTMTAAAKATMSSYPMFVPVASIYQTGRSYMYDGEKRYCETAQPYVIEYGESYKVDLSPYIFDSEKNIYTGSVQIPSGFSYTVTLNDAMNKDANGRKLYNGSFEPSGDKMFTYTPDPRHLKSGKIYVTLHITKDDGAFTVDDVDLVLEFEQTQERNKTVIERKFYEIGSSLDAHLYASAAEAYEKNYAGYELTYEGNNVNTSQNCSAEIWAPSGGYRSMKTQGQSCAPVIEIRGKLYVTSTDKYRLALHGRGSAALYVSFDNGETYELACNMKYANMPGASMVNNQDYTYDTNELESGSWIYFKGVLLAKESNSYLSLSWGRLENMAGIIQEDPDGSVWFVDANGNKMSIEEASNTEPQATLGYATAYRQSYEMVDTQFVSDYFYKRSYTGVTYRAESGTNAEARIVSSSPCAADYPAENMLKDDDSFLKSDYKTISAQTPFEVTVDLGSEIYASRMEIYGNYAGGTYLFKNFKVSVGKMLEEMEDVGVFTNANYGSTSFAQFNFAGGEKRFRYYKISASVPIGDHIEIKAIKFIYSLANGRQYSPESDFVTYKKEWSTKSGLYTFGHVMTGGKDSVAEVKFKGTRLAIMSEFAPEYGSYQVYIDGKRAGTVSLAKSTVETAYSFLSDELEFGEHTVSIRGAGTFNIDSFVLWE